MKDNFKKISSYYETVTSAVLLTIVGGFIDVYVYISRGVFAFAMTGNFVLMSIYIAQKEFAEAFTKTLPVIIFFIGAFIINYVRKILTEKQFLQFEHIALIVKIFFLFIIGFIPLSAPNYIVIVIITLLFSVQMVSFRRVDGLPYFTNLCAGNLHSATEHLCAYFISKDMKFLRNMLKYLIIIISFMIGAVLSAFSFYIFHEKSIWIACILLIIVAINYTFGQRKVNGVNFNE